MHISLFPPRNIDVIRLVRFHGAHFCTSAETFRNLWIEFSMKFRETVPPGSKNRRLVYGLTVTVRNEGSATFSCRFLLPLTLHWVEPTLLNMSTSDIRIVLYNYISTCCGRNTKVALTTELPWRLEDTKNFAHLCCILRRLCRNG